MFANLANVIPVQKAGVTLLFLISLMISSFGVCAEESVGEIQFVLGAVSIQGDDDSVRIVQKDSKIFQGDIITTGKKSFTVITLNDGTRMSLRPESVFAVESLSVIENKESAVMNLFKGGLRIITGFISKRNPNAYKIKTSVATIGIRGTRFSARLCEDDCRQEAAEKAIQQEVIVSIGRVLYAKGKLSVTNEHRHDRGIVEGGPLFQGDILTTGKKSFAVLAFKDGGKITLQADTVFAIEDINIEKGKAGSGNAFFRLVKGGVRALTGLIGRKNPDAYRIKTPVATIGIRGTGFDLRCQGSCVSQVVSSEDLSGLPLVDGLFVSVWEGSITITQDSREYVLDEEKVVFIPNVETEPVSLDELPGFMLENPAPRPDEVPLDHEVYFGTVNLIDWPPGLYVDVEEGHITMVQNDTGDELELADNEAAYVSYDGEIMVRLEWRPPFLLDDPYLDKINKLFLPLYELLNDTTIIDEFECKIF